MKIIDAWMQHPTQYFLQQEIFDSLKRWQKHMKTMSDLPLELTVAAMDEAKVNQGLLSAWCGPQGYLISNDKVASCVQQFPDRFFGVAAVDIKKPREAIKELRRCVKELNFKALRIVQWLWNLPSDHRLYYPLYAECVELDIPVCLQAGHTGPFCPSEPGRPIPYLDNVALDFPDLKIVAGHIGYPWTLEMIALATKYPNVYIDTSAYKPSRYPQELVSFIQKHGKHKVLFGTNYPMIMPKDCVAEIEKLQLNSETEELFLARNSMNVFKLS